jgi:uncharacterized protein (DUF1810 family)
MCGFPGNKKEKLAGKIRLILFHCSNLSIRLLQLFKYFTVDFTPMRCKCDKPVLRRLQTTENSQTPGYIWTVHIPEGLTLDLAIARAMREPDTKIDTTTCPDCGNSFYARDYQKFAYLPEVFFILPIFMSKQFNDGYARNTSDEQLTYPEWLDMSALDDEPEKPDDQTSHTYKLQSIVTCTDQNFNYGTRYKASLRVSEEDWVQFGYETDQGPSHATLEDINDPGMRELAEEAPHILMYARDHHIEGLGIVPDEVTPHAWEHRPRYNTDLIDWYGLESSDLGRFVEGQNQTGADTAASSFENAKSELKKGRKTSHWMWYIFPQVLFPGASRMSEFFAIKSLAEAVAYWTNPLLMTRYQTLLHIVAECQQTDLIELFGALDAVKFQASVTLFVFVCEDNDRNLFRQTIRKFDMRMHEPTVSKLVEWLNEAGERNAIEWIESLRATKNKRQAWAEHSEVDDGNQEIKVPYGQCLSRDFLSQQTLSFNENGSNSYSIVARRTMYELMRLSETGVDDSGVDPSAVTQLNKKGELLGKTIMKFALQYGENIEETPSLRESARLLGRNLLLLSKPGFKDGDWPDVHGEARSFSASLHHYRGNNDSDVETDGQNPDDGTTSGHVEIIRCYQVPDDDGHGVDNVSEIPAEVDALNQEGFDRYKVVAIPTDPKDPRIERCQSWTINQLKLECQMERLDRGGLGSDDEKHRNKFLKHFELERDYSIYHVSRLRGAIEEREIDMREYGSAPTKADMVEALTEYDTDKLGDLEYDEGNERLSTEHTDSLGFAAGEYQSSEEPDAGASPAKHVILISKKRPRDEFEDGEMYEEEVVEEEDYDKSDEEIKPRAAHQGPVQKKKGGWNWGKKAR